MEGFNALSKHNSDEKLLYKALGILWTGIVQAMETLDAQFLYNPHLDISSVNLSSTFISCQPRLKIAMFDLKVSAAGAILSATQNSSAVYGEAPSYDSSSTILNQTTLSLNSAMYVWSPAWHNDIIAVEWFNHLAKVLTNSTALLNVHSPPPDFTTASNITNQIYARTFAIRMSLLAPQLLPAKADIRPVLARRVASERRVFISEPFFYLSLTILIADLIMAIIFYWRIPRPFLPRIIAS
jgi:hypothetical protein